jgi:hypothetical protein
MHSTDTRIVFEDIKGLIRSRKSKQDRQCNGQKRTYNAMAKKGQTMQWPKKDIQCNGQKRTYNAMAKKGQTMNAMAKKDRQCNGQKGQTMQWPKRTQKDKQWSTKYYT